jgi:hypothetical protein
MPDVRHRPYGECHVLPQLRLTGQRHRYRGEYKQVTVLFADVVHSMDIASVVGAKRVREIMADLACRCAVVVNIQREEAIHGNLDDVHLPIRGTERHPTHTEERRNTQGVQFSPGKTGLRGYGQAGCR